MITQQQIVDQIKSWTDEQKQLMAGGYDNRGIECVTERWYGPDDVPEDSPIKVAARQAMILNNALSEALEDYL